MRLVTVAVQHEWACVGCVHGVRHALGGSRIHTSGVNPYKFQNLPQGFECAWGTRQAWVTAIHNRRRFLRRFIHMPIRPQNLGYQVVYKHMSPTIARGSHITQ